MSEASDALQDAVVEAAQAPKRSRHDTTEMESHSLKDLRETADWVAAQEAAGTNNFGLRMVKIVPPGCG